jgi:hypothetical protein
MKKSSLFLTAILSIFSGLLFSQNAPVTTATSVINPQVGSVITVPVKISNFSDISTISLRLDFNPTVLSLLGCVPNPALTGFIVDGTTTQGQIMASWFSVSGLTLGDETPLFLLSFKYLGGTTALTWFTANSNCEYTKFDGGAYTLLNDQPYSNFYIDGVVSNQAAPVTFAPMLTVTSNGSLSIPIMVTGFNNIGTISLSLEYDPATLVYQDNFTGNPTLNSAGNWVVGSQDAPGGKKYLRISWLKNETPPPPPVNLPDSGTLITLMFNYPDLLKSTELKWIDDGSSCEYADGSYNVLPDTPTGAFHINGAVSGTLTGPVLVAPTFGAAANMDVTLPVTVSGFENIGSFTLRLDYTPGIMTFQGAEIPNLPPSWTFTSSTPVAGQLILAGSGTGTTLGDNSILFNLKFHFAGGTSLMNWYDADNASCVFTDAATSLILFDQPQPVHYLNGNIITCSNCP